MSGVTRGSWFRVARGVYISIMMLHLLISVVAAIAAEGNIIAYCDTPSMVTGPQGINASTIWTAVQDRNAGFPLSAQPRGALDRA